jgi:hypothetical protein
MLTGARLPWIWTSHHQTVSEKPTLHHIVRHTRWLLNTWIVTGGAEVSEIFASMDSAESVLGTLFDTLEGTFGYDLLLEGATVAWLIEMPNITLETSLEAARPPWHPGAGDTGMEDVGVTTAVRCFDLPQHVTNDNPHAIRTKPIAGPTIMAVKFAGGCLLSLGDNNGD